MLPGTALCLIHLNCKPLALIGSALNLRTINAERMKLKRRMTYEEMARYLSETTGKVVNRVSVGRYAKKLGYRVYKPMINRKIQHCYLNDAIQDEETESPLTKGGDDGEK